MKPPAWVWKIALPLVSAALIWAGGSLVNLRERVSTVEADGRSATKWLERIDERLERMDEKLDRALRR